MRRLWSLIIVLIMISLAQHVSAILFSDTAGNQYETAIHDLVQRNVVQGYADGTYKPNALINRAEFLKILIDSRFPNYVPKDVRCFADLVVQVPTWYSRPVCAGKELGIVQGYTDGSFRPDRAVNLVEALKMAFLSFSITPAQVQGEWYQPYLTSAAARGILLHRLTKPDHLITRGEMASIAYTLLGGTGTSSSTGSWTCGNGMKEWPEQCDDGNKLDGDGCSSICVIVTEPIRRTIVQIDQQATGTVTTAAAGRQDVTLLRFTAIAGRQPALLSRLAFIAATGSLLYGQNYELLVDSNNDGIFELIQASARVQSNMLSFENFLVGGIYLPVGVTLPLMVRTDLLPNTGAVKLGLAFATSLPEYVQAQGYEDGLTAEGIETNGVCASSSCFIRVNTQGTTTIDVGEQGSLFISQDTLPVRSRIILAGSSSQQLLRLRLRAVREDIDVTFLSIEGVPSTIDSLKLSLLVPGDLGTSLPSPIASASRSQCATLAADRVCVRFSSRQVVVRPSEEMVLAVTADALSDTLGGTSGQTATLKLNVATGTLHAAEAAGTSSSKTLSQNDNDGTDEGEIFIGRTTVGGNTAITGVTHDIALASIGTIANAGVASASSIPSGNQSFGSFRFSALTNTNTQNGTNTARLTKLIFQVSAQNVEIESGSFRLRNASDPASTVTCSGNQTTGTITVTCSSLSGIAVEIDSGLSLILELVGNVTNTQINAGASSLSVSLPTLGQRSITNSVTWTDGITSFSWVDILETIITSTLYQR